MLLHDGQRHPDLPMHLCHLAMPMEIIPRLNVTPTLVCAGVLVLMVERLLALVTIAVILQLSIATICHLA
jgi:hypothetical protein